MKTTWRFKLLKKSGKGYTDNAGNRFCFRDAVDNPKGILFANDEDGLCRDAEPDAVTTEIGCFLVEDPVVLDPDSHEDEFRRYQTENGKCGFFRKATLVFTGVENALKHGLKTHKFLDGNKKNNSLLFYWAVMHTDLETVEKLAKKGLYHTCSRCLAHHSAERMEIHTFLRGLEVGRKDKDCGDWGCCGPQWPQ